MLGEGTGSEDPTDAAADDATRSPGWVAAIWRGRAWILLPLDAVAIVASFMISFHAARGLSLDFPTEAGPAQARLYLARGVLFSGLWVSLFALAQGYETGLRGSSAPMVRIRSFFMKGVYATALLIIVTHCLGAGHLSLWVCAGAVALTCCAMIVSRSVLLAADRWLGRRGVFTHRMVVVGINEQTREFVRRLRLSLRTIRVSGFLAWEPGGLNKRAHFTGLPILGSIDDIRAVFVMRPFDKLILSLAGMPSHVTHSRVLEILNFCEEESISLYMIPTSFDIAVDMRQVASLSGVSLIRMQDAAIHPAYAVVKRVMDMVFSLAGILVLGPLVGVPIALLIKLTGRGPVIYSQIRIGLHGKPFRIYKFRTMVQDAEALLKDLVDVDGLKAPGFKLENDPRVTRLGRFLRCSGLDELPQLYNVLVGAMSLVGPRPEMAEFVERYTPEMRRRLKAKPGITGYQQIKARGTPLAAAVRYDLIYLKHQSFLFDLYILYKTIGVVLRDSEITK